MEKREIVIYSLGILILVVVLSIAIQLKLTLSPSEKTACNVISFNGAGKESIFFFAAENVSKEYYGELFSIPPLDKNKEQFNVYYSEENVSCSLYREKALLCNSKEIIKKASSCPSDFIIVIKDENTGIRSSSYTNILSVNSKNSKKVIAHEFAHAFASLADEYVPAELPKNSKNCAPDCKNFNQNSCFEGCSRQKLFRSFDSGLMRTLSADSFGSFDESIIEEKILKINPWLTGRPILDNSKDCENSRYYLIEANYTNNKIIILNQSVEIGCSGGNGDGSFNYTIISSDNAILYAGQFSADIIYIDSATQSELSGGAEEYSEEFFIRMPYSENSERISLSYNDKTEELKLKNPANRPCPI